MEPGTRNLIAAIAVVLLWPATSSAQTSGGISLRPADLPRWDVSGDVGWLSSNKSEVGPDWNDWYDAFSAGGSAGFYVTPNLKAELRLAFSGEGSIYEEERLDTPGQPFPVFRLREHHFREATLRGGVAYQFFQNQWFHPHVGAGLEVARESDRMFAPAWRVPSRDPGAPLVIPEVDGGTTVSWAVRPVVSAGFKWYVNERGFIRSDLGVTIGNKRASHVVWSVGIGVDL